MQEVAVLQGFLWCRLRGLNSRPSVYKTAALLLKLNQLTKRSRLRGQAPARHIGQPRMLCTACDHRGADVGPSWLHHG